jgi:hypothetical protein
MNSTPRLLNRVLIGILGLVLLAAGILLMLLATVPAVGVWWQAWSGGVWASASQLLGATRFPGRQESWLWIVLALVLILLIGLMVAWVAQQGKGRSDLLLAAEDPGGVPGDVRIGSGVAEQSLKEAFAERPDLAGTTVTTFDIRGEPALRIRLHPRPGVAPHLLVADAAALVSALDRVVGRETPVLVHIAAGARTRFSRAERVR